MKLSYAAATDVGRKRSLNEDSFAVFSNVGHLEMNAEYSLDEYGVFMVVADGMGGHRAGEIASQMAVTEIEKFVKKLPASWNQSSAFIQKSLGNAIEWAHTKIVKHSSKHPETRGMGTTVVLAYLLGDRIYMAWAGDSRLYHRHQPLYIQLTSDHTRVQELLEAGEIYYYEKYFHPERHVVTKYLGGYEEHVDPEIRVNRFGVGDRVLLCTDGLSNMLVNRQIIDLSVQADLTKCVKDLINEANAVGGEDNITVVLAEISE